MRRLAFRIDQLPAWAFVLGAMVAFGFVRASRLFALLHHSRGGMDLGGILTVAVFLGVVIFAVRRRQVPAWRSTMHVLGVAVAGNALGIVLIWPLVPQSYSVGLLPMLRDTLGAGAWTAIISLPIAIALLWLSRRFGSHSQLTERRLRVVRAEWLRRFARDQADGDTP